jgi:arylformamidase
MIAIDLTHTIEEGMLTFNAPWHPTVEITQLGRLDVEGRRTCKLVLGSHTGTHMDAPLHFIKGGKTIDVLPIEKMLGDVSIIDFSFLRENDCITYEILKNFKLKKKVLFNLGWAQYWGTRKFYKGYPYFSSEAALYLVEQDVELIGMDTPSPDNSNITLAGDVLGSDLDSPMHKIFLKNDIILLEYLANLNKVEKNFDGWKLVAMPLKLGGADGAPARVFIYKEG